MATKISQPSAEFVRLAGGESGGRRVRERVVVERKLDGRERREDPRRTCERNFGVGKMERMVSVEGQGEFGRGDGEKTDN